MTELAALDMHGTLVEPTTLRIQRLLPGPIERAWVMEVLVPVATWGPGGT